MRLNKALSQIKPSDGQRVRIYSDVLDKLERPLEETSEAGKEKRFVMKKRNIIMSAAACAVVLIGGLTVTAANFGWGHKLFGNTASLVESNMDDYKLKVGDVKIENAEGVPYKFTLGDVISDGYNIYFNLLVEDMPAELDEFGDWNDPGTAYPPDGSACRSSWRTSSWMTTGKNGNIVSTAVYAHFNKKFEKGDVLEFRFDDDRRRLDPLNHIDEAENARAFLADISFEIESDVKDLTKTFDVNQTAIFKDRWPYSPGWGGEAPDEDKLITVEMYVETVSISPFGFSIQGTEDFSQPNGNAFGSWGNMWLIYKNGDRVCIEAHTGQTEKTENCIEAVYFGDFSNSHGGKPLGVQNLDDIEAIDICGIIVPLNQETELETEEIPE